MNLFTFLNYYLSYPDKKIAIDILHKEGNEILSMTVSLINTAINK